MSFSNLISEDEYFIDLRQFVNLMWRGKWLLLAFMVVFSVGAWVVSAKFVQPRYRAEATVSVNFARVPSAISARLPALYYVPDLRTLANLLDEDEVLQKVVEGEGVSVKEMRRRAHVEVLSRDSLRLTVVASNPELAARLVNKWADMVDDEARALYHLGTLEEQWRGLIQSDWQKYQDLSNQVYNFWANQNLDLMSTNLDRISADYVCALRWWEALTVAQGEIAHFKSRLSSLPQEQPVAPEDAPRIWQLVTFDWKNPTCGSVLDTGRALISIAPPEDLTVGEALKALDRAEQDIADAQKRTNEQVLLLKSKLQSSALALNKLNDELTQLNNQRAYVFSEYRNFKSQAAWFEFMKRKGAIARVVQKATPPPSPYSPRVALNVVFAALLGLSFGVVWLFVKDWWEHLGNKPLA